MPAPSTALDDADRFVDGQRAVAGGIERVDLAAGRGLGDDVGEGPAWRGAAAIVGIAADARDERAQAERLCGCGVQGSCAREPSGDQDCDAVHYISPETGCRCRVHAGAIA